MERLKYLATFTKNDYILYFLYSNCRSMCSKRGKRTTIILAIIIKVKNPVVLLEVSVSKLVRLVIHFPAGVTVQGSKWKHKTFSYS